VALARQIVQDINDTLREQAEIMLALKAENDQLRAALAQSAGSGIWVGTISSGDIEGNEIDWDVELDRKVVDSLPQLRVPNQHFGLFMAPLYTTPPAAVQPIYWCGEQITTTERMAEIVKEWAAKAWDDGNSAAKQPDSGRDAAPWESFSVEKTGDVHYDASNFLLQAAVEWWGASKRAGVSGAVKWLDSDDGALLIYTRGEYRDQLMKNIHELGQKPINFVKPTENAAVQSLTDAENSEVHIENPPPFFPYNPDGVEGMGDRAMLWNYGQLVGWRMGAAASAKGGK